MYCPICFKNSLKIRSTGVVKLTFDGKSRATSLFTYNLQKETQEQLDLKLRDKIADFFTFYSTLTNRTPIKNVEIFSADFVCINNCKMDLHTTKVSVINIIYPIRVVRKILHQEAEKFGILLDVSVG